MDSEQRRRRIQEIRNTYERLGEAPSLLCTSLLGPFSSSPWKQTPVNLMHSIPHESTSTEHQEQQPEEDTTMKESESVEQQQQQQQNLPVDESAQDFDSDDERTLPYNVYDDPQDEEMAVSTLPS